MNRASVFILMFIAMVIIGVIYQYYPVEAVDLSPIESNAPDSIVLKDKETIIEDYYKNLEFYRLHLQNGAHRVLQSTVENVDSTTEAYSYAFYPFMVRYTSSSNLLIKSPMRSESQVTATVERIYYNHDASLFFAIMVVETHFSHVAGLRDEKHAYWGWAICGYRDDKDKKVRHFSILKQEAIHQVSKEDAIWIEEGYYSRYFKDDGLAGSFFEGQKYGSNLGDPDFFEKCLLFQKYDSVHYYFQFYPYSKPPELMRNPYGTD